jgi:hypothetical protein
MGGFSMANGTFWKQFGLAILVSMVGVLIVWLLAMVISPDIRVDTPFEENAKLEWYGPSLAMIVPYGIGAAIVSWLLLRFQKPRMWLYVITVIALIGMGLQAFVQANTTESAIWLNVMHLVAVACIVPVVARFLPES